MILLNLLDIKFVFDLKKKIIFKEKLIGRS